MQQLRLNPRVISKQFNDLNDLFAFLISNAAISFFQTSDVLEARIGNKDHGLKAKDFSSPSKSQQQ